MTLKKFVNFALKIGQLAKYNDGEFLGECVSLINQYCYRVLNVPASAWGHAWAWGSKNNTEVRKYFTQLEADTALRAGDVLVYDDSYGGGVGHIELYIGGGMALEQNRGFDYRIHKQEVLQGYYRVLRPKTKLPEESKPMTGTEKNYYAQGKVSKNIAPLSKPLDVEFISDGYMIDLPQAYQGKIKNIKKYKKGQRRQYDAQIKMTVNGKRQRYYLFSEDVLKGRLYGVPADIIKGVK